MAGAVPPLALDMYEHAYHIDFGADAAGYVDAFMASIDWARVYARYQQAVHAASEGLAADARQLDGAQLVDVRHAGVFAQAATLLPGATWRACYRAVSMHGRLQADRWLTSRTLPDAGAGGPRPA